MQRHSALQSLVFSLTLAVVSTLVAPLANASGDKGHGGSGTVCFGRYNPQLKRREVVSATLTDFNEAKLGTWIVDLGRDRPGVDDRNTMIQVAIERLRARDAYRAEILEKKVAEVLTTWHGLDLDTDQFELAKIADANTLISPSAEGCYPKQLAFNKVRPGYREHKYAYVKQFVAALPDAHRAGLVLHEALYNFEAEMGAGDSDGTRKQVLAMSSGQFPEFSLKDYWDFVTLNSMRPTVTAANGSFSQVARIEDEFVTRGVLVGKTNYPAIAVKSGDRFEKMEIPAVATSDEEINFYQVEGAHGAYLPQGGTVVGANFTASVAKLEMDPKTGTLAPFPCVLTAVQEKDFYYADRLKPAYGTCSALDPTALVTRQAAVEGSSCSEFQLSFATGVSTFNSCWMPSVVFQFDQQGALTKVDLTPEIGHGKREVKFKDSSGRQGILECKNRDVLILHFNPETGILEKSTTRDRPKK